MRATTSLRILAPRLPLARRLDLVRPGIALGVGTVLGAVATAPLIAVDHPHVAMAVGCVTLSGAWLLAATGKPLASLAVNAEPSSPPPPTRDTHPWTPAALVDAVEMVEIAGGAFPMGSPETEDGRQLDEGPVHNVSLRGFALGKVPITQAQFEHVMSFNPGHPTDGLLPVNNTSWHDALVFCNRLSMRAGLDPCYHAVVGEIFWDRAANGYRLPTEAEWEYAARAGTTSAYPFGDDAELASTHCQFIGNSGRALRPSGDRAPNRWGLLEMSGTVWEWCWDAYAPYSAPAEIEPTGPPSGGLRVLRGGSFLDPPEDLRAARRAFFDPSVQIGRVGFRCARSARRPPVTVTPAG